MKQATNIIDAADDYRHDLFIAAQKLENKTRLVREKVEQEQISHDIYMYLAILSFKISTACFGFWLLAT